MKSIQGTQFGLQAVEHPVGANLIGPCAGMLDHPVVSFELRA